MYPRRSLILDIRNTYGLNDRQAEAMLEYNITLRGRLNQMHAMAQIAEGVELRNGVAADLTEAAKEFAGAIPVFGGVAQALGYVAYKGVQATERAFKLGEASKIIEMNPSRDPSEWAQFSKELSQTAAEKQLAAIKDLSPAQVKEVAIRDSDSIAKEILEGRVKTGILDDEIIPNLVNKVRFANIVSEIEELKPSTAPRPQSNSALAPKSVNKVAPAA